MSSYSPAAVQVTLTAETLACGSMAWLKRAAALRPDRTAIEAPDGRLTYAELLTAARDAAGALEGRVEIEARPGLDFVVRLHACLLAGGGGVPVDPRAGPEGGARVGGGAGA